jgi:hypothetical protein
MRRVSLRDWGHACKVRNFQVVSLTQSLVNIELMQCKHALLCVLWHPDAHPLAPSMYTSGRSFSASLLAFPKLLDSTLKSILQQVSCCTQLL